MLWRARRGLLRQSPRLVVRATRRPSDMPLARETLCGSPRRCVVGCRGSLCVPAAELRVHRRRWGTSLVSEGGLAERDFGLHVYETRNAHRHTARSPMRGTEVREDAAHGRSRSRSRGRRLRRRVQQDRAGRLQRADRVTNGSPAGTGSNKCETLKRGERKGAAGAAGVLERAGHTEGAVGGVGAVGLLAGQADREIL